MVTNEKLFLEGGPWELVFGEDGFGVAVSDDPTVSAVALEDAFRFSLYEVGSADNLYVGTSLSQHAGQMVSLAEFKAKYTSMQVSIHLGPTHACKCFEVVVYRWPRSPNAK
eukprot:1701661-Alexandrium_andersonii.AAC.1